MKDKYGLVIKKALYSFVHAFMYLLMCFYIHELIYIGETTLSFIQAVFL